jgi:hypothetical protein
MADRKLREFLYLDGTLTRSLFAQLEGGVVEQISSSKESTHKLTGGIDGSIPFVAALIELKTEQTTSFGILSDSAREFESRRQLIASSGNFAFRRGMIGLRMTNDESKPTDEQVAAWPEVLRRALTDHWEFGVVLRTGPVIKFANAKFVNPEWVRLFEISGPDGDRLKELGDTRRGVDVRVADIVAAIDFGH